MSSVQTQPVPDFVAGIEALVKEDRDAEHCKDLVLCYVCMQWSCDGPDCHRPGVCEAQTLAAHA